ncbi:MAG: hypothetical protein K8S98_07770 [Planctomycetes bacterium]|nr:hypothetical protein [Planctomycetota bacterium]
MNTPTLFPELAPKPPPAAKRLSFDLELASVFDLQPGQDLWAHAPFDLAVVAIATDRDEVRHWYEIGADGKPARCLSKSHARDVLAFLRDAQRSGVQVCAWNGVSFDARALGETAGDYALAAEVALDMIDPMFQFFQQRGFLIGLAKVAEGLGLPQKKLMLGADAPKEWARGNHQGVLDYVAGDCRLTNAVIARIEERRVVRWRTAKGTVSEEPMPRFLSARELLRLPPPDTSWMKERPLKRERFYEWMIPHAKFEVARS